MKNWFINLLKPWSLEKWYIDLTIAIPRVVAGISLSLEFGSSKFGMPWSYNEEMGLLQVAEWFPKDVAEFGFPFTISPLAFAWMGAASEAIGGLFLALGLGTRITSVFIGLTMLTAIFLQKWPDAMEYGSSWPLLPALGFFWVALYSLVLGSGRFGLDTFLYRRLTR